MDTCPTAHGGVTKFNESDFHNFDGNLNYGVANAANPTPDPSRYQLPLGGPIDGQASTTSLDAVSTGFRWAQGPQGPNNFQQLAYPHVNRADTPMFMYLPMIFTFCSAPAQSLPMISLQYHDCRVSAKLNTIDTVSIFQSVGGGLRVKDAPQITATGAGINMSLVATYIFLDDAERRSTALSPHQFLMTEIQTQQFAVDPNATRGQYQLYFNHPVTEVFVYLVKNAYRDTSSPAVVNHYWNWTFDGPQVELSNYDATEAALGAPGYRQAFSRMNLALNQQKIYDDSMDAQWFTWFQPNKYHTRTPQGSDRVAIIPFALDCETWRPTGSVNFSRIDSVMLQLEFDVPAGKHLPAATAYVVVRNLNLFKITGGMGGELSCFVVTTLIRPGALAVPFIHIPLLTCRQAIRQLERLSKHGYVNSVLQQILLVHGIFKMRQSNNESMPLPIAKINELRSRHHVQPLREDKELSKSAQGWADRLAREHAFKHSNQAGKGENLAAGSSAEQAVDMWYGERDKYDWSNPRFTGATGHFSALVWAATDRIGWGEARDDSKGWTIFVAQFQSPGNVSGQFKDNVRHE